MFRSNSLAHVGAEHVEDLNAEHDGFEEYMLGNGVAPAELAVLRASLIQ